MSPLRPARDSGCRRLPISLLVLLLSAAPFAASAAGAQAADSTGWSASGELSFTDVSGNTDLSLLATSLTVDRRGGAAYDANATAAVRYGTNEGEVAAKSAIASAEVRLRPLARLSPFASASVERDEVRLLLVRVAGALGVDLNLIREEARRLSVGGAVLQDYEKRDALEGSLTDPSVSTTRLVMRLTGQTPLREGITLEHESRIEPAAEDFSDYLLRSQTALRAVLSSRLAFQTSYLFTRDNIPPEGVTFKDDRMLMVGLVVQLTPPAAP